MASPRTPPEHSRFKKGVSGNPGGKPKQGAHPFKQTSYKNFIDHLQRYGAFTKAEIQAELKRPDATMFELMFSKTVYQASQGEKDARTLLLDRLWGKVKEVQEVYQQELKDTLNKIPPEKIEELLRSADIVD